MTRRCGTNMVTSLVECAMPCSTIWKVKPAELQRQRTVEADFGLTSSAPL